MNPILIKFIKRQMLVLCYRHDSIPRDQGHHVTMIIVMNVHRSTLQANYRRNLHQLAKNINKFIGRKTKQTRVPRNNINIGRSFEHL